MSKIGYKKYMLSLRQRHYYHMVTPSPWPFLMSVAVCVLVLAVVGYLHFFKGAGYLIVWGLISVVYILCLWFRDVIRESTFEGMHTSFVQKNLKLGFALFIMTEIMFFFGFFWAYFHVSLNPAVEIGCIWPPPGIKPIYPYALPLLNTLLLLQSGVFITVCHMYIRLGRIASVLLYFFFTLFCGFFFTFIQVYEYYFSTFAISDGVYGSTFFMLTGFHGLHVLIGSIFIIVCFVRSYYGHFTRNHHVGFECAAWYWHFVDVVWLFLFIAVYIWGGWSVR